MSNTQFHLPSNTVNAQRGEIVRAQVELQGKARRMTFSYYGKKNTFRVAVQSKGFGMVMIGRAKDGWQAKHFNKPGWNTFEPSGVQSKVYSNPKDAFVEIAAVWGAKATAAEAALL